MYSFKTADGDGLTATEVKAYGRDSKRSIRQSKQRRGKWILTYRNTITRYITEKSSSGKSAKAFEADLPPAAISLNAPLKDYPL